VKVRELIEQLKEQDQEADVYYSTGSSMDDTFGDQHEVENCLADTKQIGILTSKPTTINVVILEGI
jgi:hypothetical protein